MTLMSATKILILSMEKTYYERVYEITNKIPVGSVPTYGAIADYLTLGSARMVGWALNKSFSSGIEVAAHRVVNRKGELSGRHHFATPTLMAELLLQEGVEVQNDKVVNFKSLFWHPSELLR